MTTNTTVSTAAVKDRRTVRYESYDEFLADADRLAAGSAKTVGNWNYGQILKHLAIAFEACIDGGLAPVPLPVRLFARLLMKNRFLNRGVPAGFKIPKSGVRQFEPDADVTVSEALDHLCRAVDRCKTESSRADHPVFGKITREEWDKFNLRHAELHMSFAVSESS